MSVCVTKIALRHRDVNYKGVTVALKDVGSMFIALKQRICLIYRLTRTNETENESFPEWERRSSLCASIKLNRALFFSARRNCGDCWCILVAC